MKRTLLITLGIILSITVIAQDFNEDISSRLFSGCPKEIEPIKNQLGLKNISYANLKTGVDSIRVVFGKMTQGNNEGYWVSSYFNDNLKSFSTVSLNQEESNNYLSNNVEIKLDNSTKKILFHVRHNSLTNDVIYHWLDGNEKSKKLII